MLYAVLECSNADCEISYEAWGEPAALEALECAECGRPLRMLAFANADRDGVVPPSTELQQRDAA